MMTRTKPKPIKLLPLLLATALVGCASVGVKLILTAEYTAAPFPAVVPPTSNPSPGE